MAQKKSDQELFNEFKHCVETHGVFVFKKGNKSRYIFPDETIPDWITLGNIPQYRILSRSERKKLERKPMPYAATVAKPINKTVSGYKSFLNFFANLFTKKENE